MPGSLSRRKIDIFRALDCFRGELKGPGENERDWKSDHNGEDNQPDRPVRYLEERKNLRRDLN